MPNSENLSKINQFRQEFIGVYYKPWTEDDLKRFFNQPQNKLLTMEDGSIGMVGMAMVHISESLTRKALIIEDFIIDKTFRGMGFGTKLLQKVINLGKEINADCIEVDLKKHNEIAKLMYKNAGFEDRKQLSLRLWI